MNRQICFKYALGAFIGLFPCMMSAQEVVGSSALPPSESPLSGKDKNATTMMKMAEKEGSGKETTKLKSGRPKKPYLYYHHGDSEINFGVRARMPDFLLGKNLKFINDLNPTDRILFFRHTIDFVTEYWYGKAAADFDLVYFKMQIRNRAIWGDPESIGSTTNSTIKELEAVFGRHSHAIPRLFLWIRELWIQFNASELLGLPFCNQHTMTFGAFPFELGRGIALGAAFSLDPTDLGFFNESGIDQYAFGGKLSGDIYKGELTYDVYAAILSNFADTFDNVNQKIRGQQFGFRQDQARGFGIINYVVAGRLVYTPKLKRPGQSIRVEPYILYNHNPEQRVEVPGDATSDLGTAGIAGEFELGNFDCGFDTAFNFGHQNVHGWDRNGIKLENRDGDAVVVNTHVRQAAEGIPNARTSPLALKARVNQAIINTSAQTAEDNGVIIGQNNLGTLINGPFRFTNPSRNQYRGMMLVYDMGYYICKPELKVCAGFGYASGDRNPNRDQRFTGDSDQAKTYEGFIGLQEIYSGTRVKSAFLLSGQGKIPRALTFPAPEVFDPFATVANRFTNVLFSGASVFWKPAWSCKKWTLNPNMVAFWSDFSTSFFDETQGRRGRNVQGSFARNYLGLETNVFIEAMLIEDLKLITVAGVFFPGAHFRDIQGRPLTRDQREFLNNVDVSGIQNDRVPLLGSDKAYFINVALEYRF